MKITSKPYGALVLSWQNEVGVDSHKIIAMILLKTYKHLS